MSKEETEQAQKAWQEHNGGREVLIEGCNTEVMTHTWTGDGHPARTVAYRGRPLFFPLPFIISSDMEACATVLGRAQSD